MDGLRQTRGAGDFWLVCGSPLRAKDARDIISELSREFWDGRHAAILLEGNVHLPPPSDRTFSERRHSELDRLLDALPEGQRAPAPAVRS